MGSQLDRACCCCLSVCPHLGDVEEVVAGAGRGVELDLRGQVGARVLLREHVQGRHLRVPASQTASQPHPNREGVVTQRHTTAGMAHLTLKTPCLAAYYLRLVLV